jgi:predicted MPP superfamily phosphohydrolase
MKWMPRLSRRQFLRRSAFGLAGLAVATSVYGGAERGWVDVERREVILPRLPAAFDGFPLVHLSDFHFGRLLTSGLVEEVIEVTRNLAAEAIFLTGDFVTSASSGVLERVTDALRGLSAPHGVWGVLGNHDHWTNSEKVGAAVTRAGIRLLCNSAGVLERGRSRLWIAGVDDVLVRKADLAAALSDVPHEETAVLLVHEPDYADVARLDTRIALQLSGHSHGGQICVPGIGPLRLPPWGRKYYRGLYEIGDYRVYTTRGIGTLALPVRINCRPEVTHLTLRAA